MPRPALRLFAPATALASAPALALTLAFAFAFALALALSPCCLAQRNAPLPAAELTPAQHAQLDRDKLIIGAKNYPQIFSPYIALGRSPDSIRFITSDAALAAYHGLFEDSFHELESRRAARLPGDLEKLYKACIAGPDPDLSDKDKKPAPAPKLIQLILGPALVILGTPATADNFSKELIPEINRQAALIRAAAAVECPPWLNYRKDPNFKIDYRRCKPVSFYADANDPALADYYRVVRWLQLVPFRATNDDELKAWARMVSVSNALWFGFELPDFAASFTGLSLFVGPVADRAIIVGNTEICAACRALESGDANKNKAKNLARLRDALLANERQNPPRSTVNDEIRSKPAKDTPPLSEIRFRVMPTYALPDAEILSACLAEGIHPNGLAVAAFLGSAFAREHMPKINDDKWAAADKRARQLMFPQDGEPRSLYADYIDVLRTLNAPPIKEAPAFMRALPWQIKTCQTQLASWSQIRHTYALQTRTTTDIPGIEPPPPPPPPGFVEPNPAFWREYVRLVERTIALLDAEDVLKPTGFACVRNYRAVADEIETTGFTKDDAKLDILHDSKNKEVLETAARLMWFDKELQAQKLAEKLGNPDNYFTTPEKMRASCEQAAALLRAYAGKMERGEMKPQYDYAGYYPAARWDILVTLSRQLETILAKQLDEIELTDSERSILISYGYTVADSMGHHGEAIDPDDDAPRWVEVAQDPNTGQSLGVATGRARALFVLYPWHGRELLCTGAVLSYYEEWAPPQRLTDAEWKQKLDSPAAPAPPAWLAPILAK